MDMIFSLLLSLSFFGSPPDSPKERIADNCDQLMVTFTIEETGDRNQMKFELKATGGKEPYYYFFVDKDKKSLTPESKKNYIVTDRKNQPKYGMVADSKGCMKTIEFNESKRK